MTEMTIRRVGILSVAKIQALLMFVIGLIIGVIYGLFFMVFGAAIAALAPAHEGQALGGVGSVVGGVIIMIVFADHVFSNGFYRWCDRRFGLQLRSWDRRRYTIAAGRCESRLFGTAPASTMERESFAGPIILRSTGP